MSGIPGDLPCELLLRDGAKDQARKIGRHRTQLLAVAGSRGWSWQSRSGIKPSWNGAIPRLVVVVRESNQVPGSQNPTLLVAYFGGTFGRDVEPIGLFLSE